MRKLTLFLFAIISFILGKAQTPQALNYQAVARNSLGQIVPSQPVSVRFTITDATGNSTLYQETHTTTTNNFGLFTLSIGKGTAVSGTIPNIDWSAGGDKYLKVEIAPQGGTNYTIQGMTQLLSVPYALYSEKTKLVAGNAITITGGNTINANYTSGTGISITGNVISSTIPSYWVADANGIHNSNAGGHVGIGGSASNLSALFVQMMEGTADGRGTARLLSNDIWQTNLRVDNSSVDYGISVIIGGSDNTRPNEGVGVRNFGIAHGPVSTGTSTIPLIITTDNMVGISNSNGGTNNLPRSRLHVRDGDIYIDQIGSGVIMKSPNGQCWRMTVSNTGTPVFTAIPCP